MMPDVPLSRVDRPLGLADSRAPAACFTRQDDVPAEQNISGLYQVRYSQLLDADRAACCDRWSSYQRLGRIMMLTLLQLMEKMVRLPTD